MWQAWSAVSFVDDARHETTQAPAVTRVGRYCWTLARRVYALSDRSDWFARARVRKCASARRAGNNHTKNKQQFPNMSCREVGYSSVCYFLTSVQCFLTLFSTRPSAPRTALLRLALGLAFGRCRRCSLPAMAPPPADRAGPGDGTGAGAGTGPSSHTSGSNGWRAARPGRTSGSHAW